MSLLVPYLGDQQQQIAAFDVDGPVQDSLCPIAGYWNTGLLPYSTVATVERRRFTYYDLVEHHNDCSLLVEKPLFKPPFACRQVVVRIARV